MKRGFLTILAVFCFAAGLQAQYSYNTAAEFNNSYIAIPAEAEVKPTNAITIEAWIKPKFAAQQNVQSIFGHNYLQQQEAFLGINHTTNKLMFGGAGTILTSKTPIPAGVWTHVAVTYDRAVKHIWINGMLDTSRTNTEPLLNVTDSLYIGATMFNGSKGLYYFGQIDDLRIWNKAKTQAEILRDMYLPLANMRPSGVYTGLTAAWRFNIPGLFSYDEGGIVANSGYNRNVTVASYMNKASVHYEYNSSLVLDGIEDKCTVAPNPGIDATTALTLEAWIKRDTTGTSDTWQEIVDKIGNNQSYRLYIKNNGEVTFLINSTPHYLTTAPIVTSSQWTHLAATYNSVNGQMKIYVNGDSVASKTLSTPEQIQNPADSLYIGGTGNQFFKGQIDEVRIWKNTVRTSAEIKANMHKSLNFRSLPIPQNLVVYSFDGRVDDTGSEGIAGGNRALQFRGDAYMHSNKRNGKQLASPILSDDEGDFMGATYNNSKRRFYVPDDGGVTSAYDSIYFNTGGTVSNMKVYIMMNSHSSSHTEITLTAPNGTSIQLTPEAVNGDAGFNGCNDLMTIFDQSADTTITYAYQNMLAPFSPKIKPYQSLAAFNGLSRKGWWKIKFTDMENFDRAFVHGWGIQTSTLTSNDPVTETPYEFSLKQNYPNPFNPATAINYELKITNYVKLNVYDITGKLVSTLVNNVQEAGKHTVTFNASQLASGVYFYKLETEGFTDTKRMLLVK
jgi:archaellum component FlaG (FlaF/FlaG flagellin family)